MTEVGALPDQAVAKTPTLQQLIRGASRGWQAVLLGDICLNGPQNGAFIKRPEWGEGTLFINVVDAYQDIVVKLSGVQRLHCEPSVVQRYRLQPGDLLFVRSSLKREGVGECCLVDEVDEPAIFDCHLMRVSPDQNVTAPLFLAYFFQSYMARSDLVARSKTTTMTTINQRALAESLVLLPPLAEQRAIANMLHTVQYAIQARRREIELERERKAALMQHLFTHGTRGEPTKQTEIGEMPESWRAVQLGDIATISSGGTPDRARPEYWIGGTIPWVKTGEINYNIIMRTEECITPSGLENSSARLAPAGALLMAMYGQGVTRGRVAILGIEATLNQACAAIRTSGDVETDFLFQYLAYSYERIRNLGHGANQKNLNALLIKSIAIPLPEVREQRNIAEVLTNCDAELAALEQEVTLLEELFHVLLEELMTGRLSTLPLVEAETGVPA